MEDHSPDTERRLARLEERQTMIEATVAELQAAVAGLTSAFTTFAADVNTTIADIEAKEAQGGTITAAELGPIKESLTALTGSVQAADTAVKGHDPGPAPAPAPAEPTSETVTVSIDANGEGSTQIFYPPSRVTIDTGPATGTATLEPVEGAQDATLLKIVGGTPESTETVVVSIAAAQETPAAE
jgi:uncharacterized coiled-coil protein SlyX